MYPVVLGVHNVVRWLVLGVGAWALVAMWRGWMRRVPFTSRERRTLAFFTATLDLQLLLGLILYAVSPLTRLVFDDFDAAMGEPSVRYFVLEHGIIMLAAITAAHVGSARVKRATTDAVKYQQATMWFGIAFAAVLGFVPWARPLVPGF